MPDEFHTIGSAAGGVGGMAGLWALARSYFQIGNNTKMIEKLEKKQENQEHKTSEIQADLKGLHVSVDEMKDDIHEIKEFIKPQTAILQSIEGHLRVISEK